MKIMADKILHMFFDIDRWTKAIEKGVFKDIRKDQLIRLTDEHTRLAIADAMLKGKYEISPPHTALIPKDNGEFRTVYVNEPMDRVILSIANDLLFDLMPEMLHKSCKSYQTGIGCGKVVKEVSLQITNAPSGDCLGWKSDLSKYFDSVPLRYIDEAFDNVETKYGHSARGGRKKFDSLVLVYVLLENRLGSPPHSITIIDIIKFLTSMVNLLLAVLYPRLLACLYMSINIATIRLMYIITCIPLVFRETKWLTFNSCLINLKNTSISHLLL